MLGAWRKLFDAGLVADPFRYPGLDAVTLRPRYQSQEKDERLAVVAVPASGRAATPVPPRPGEAIVTTRDIISPDMAGDIVRRLSALDGVRGYVGGRSYEGRDVPVLELFLPFEKYVSLPRLVTLKPTLQAVARQHANEVSSTNYLLRFAELLARDPATREALKKMSFVFEPMENPDGAELAFAMQKNEPFHSLHAGRYGALGVDMGYQTGAKPLLPEAAVRTRLYDRWVPDVFLNLHGYPSHEWVQPFSNYTPYLFRDYWIPKGWFAYFKALSLPLYPEHREAGRDADDAHRRGAQRGSGDRRLEPQVLRPLRALVGPLGAAHERARDRRRGQHLRQAPGPGREPADAAGPGDLQRADARAHGRDGDRGLARVPLRAGPGLPPGPRQVPRPGRSSRSSGSRKRSGTGSA